MAELLGIVSGGAGLASLVLQLCDSASRLRRLYKRYRDAPEWLERTAFEVETFSLTLREIEKHRVYDATPGNVTFGRCLDLCRQSVSRIHELTTRLENTLQKNRTWGKMRMVVNEEGINRLRGDLDGAKTTLSVAFQLFSESRRQRDDSCYRSAFHHTQQLLLQQANTLQAQQWSLERLSIGVLRMQRSYQPASAAMFAQPTTVYKGFQNLDERSRRCHRAGGRRVTKGWRLHVKLRPWFLSRIWEISVLNSLAGWTACLRTHNLVPPDSPIMLAAGRGDVIGVKGLIDEGKASPYDYCEQDGHSYSVLKIASVNWHFSVVEYLMRFVDGVGDLLLIEGSSCKHHLTPTYRDLWSKLIIEQGEADADFLLGWSRKASTSAALRLWNLWADDQLIYRMQNSLPVPYDRLPIEMRFNKAVRLSAYHPPTMLSRWVAINFSEPWMAMLQDDDGTTALHFAAAQIAASPHWQSWWRPLVQLLQMHPDLYACDKRNRTPLHRLLSDCPPVHLTERLRFCVDALFVSGVDLHSYGRYYNVEDDGYFEIRTWPRSNGMYHRPGFAFFKYGRPYADGRELFVELLTGPRPSDWDILLYVWDHIKVLAPKSRMATVPGAWLENKSAAISMPYIFDALDEHIPLKGTADVQWKPLGHRSFQLGPVRGASISKPWGLQPDLAWLARNRDDVDPMMLKRTRGTETSPDRRRRSLSSPPHFRSSMEWALLELSDPCAPPFGFVHLESHLCRSDNRRKQGFALPWRGCMRDAHDYDRVRAEEIEINMSMYSNEYRTLRDA